MGFSVLLVAIALSSPQVPGKVDIDAAAEAAKHEIDSPHLRDRMTVAMSMPYAYGVTQMPCKARELQPTRGWVPAREPSGKIEWIRDEALSAKWAGIYGTCYIGSPIPKGELPLPERTALECECNGWEARGIKEYPLP